MKYKNSEMKVDQLVSYLVTTKINLSPAFQRGHVWSLTLRRALMKNVLDGKPIPAVFFYKETSGAAYAYNILDGKQRLETLILFIGNQRPDLKIDNWRDYFFQESQRKNFQFKVTRDGKKRDIQSLGEDVIRELKEYVIPTIEITLDDSTTLDEIISLFVDINQKGVKVERFQIVKAMYQHGALLRKVFDLVAVKQTRGKDAYYKAKRTDFSRVLRVLQSAQIAEGDNKRVDIMWERLIELAIFTATNTHRKPTEILKEFIGGKSLTRQTLKTGDLKKLAGVFSFLRKAYKATVSKTRLATDYTHFYTLATSLIGTDLLHRFSEKSLIKKLKRFADLLDRTSRLKLTSGQQEELSKYVELSSRQTTDPSRRKDRGSIFLALIEAL
jgi:hypothetical protein